MIKWRIDAGKRSYKLINAQQLEVLHFFKSFGVDTERQVVENGYKSLHH